MPVSSVLTHNEPLEVRITEEERALMRLVEAARELLADRDQFTLSPEAWAEWERIARRRSRQLPGLRRLMQRSSPFSAAGPPHPL